MLGSQPVQDSEHESGTDMFYRRISLCSWCGGWIGKGETGQESWEEAGAVQSVMQRQSQGRAGAMGRRG